MKNTMGNKFLVMAIGALIFGAIGYFIDKKMTGPDGLTPSGAKAGHAFLILGIIAGILAAPGISSAIFKPKTPAAPATKS